MLEREPVHGPPRSAVAAATDAVVLAVTAGPIAVAVPLILVVCLAFALICSGFLLPLAAYERAVGRRIRPRWLNLALERETESPSPLRGDG